MITEKSIRRYSLLSFALLMFFSSVSCGRFFNAFLGPKIVKTKPFGPIEKESKVDNKKNIDQAKQLRDEKKEDILPEIIVTANSLNIRSGPGTSFSIIGQCKKGDKFKLIEKANEWIKIHFPENKEGWISSQYVEITKENIKSN